MTLLRHAEVRANGSGPKWPARRQAPRALKGDGPGAWAVSVEARAEPTPLLCATVRVGASLSPPDGEVTVAATFCLTFVTISGISRQSCSPKGHQPATPADGARAVPAGGGSSPPLPGGFGKTPGRHDDRSAGQPAALGRQGAGNARSYLVPSQEARTGAELWRSVAAASAVVERR
jgi:hypothetical protein